MPWLYWVLFILTVIPYLLAGTAGYCRTRDFGRLDNHHPRLQQQQLTGIGARAVAAQGNAWEALAVFVTVVLIAYMAGLNEASLALPATLFLIARVLHAVFYLFNLATLRSLVFMAGMFTCMYIVYLAAAAV